MRIAMCHAMRSLMLMVLLSISMLLPGSPRAIAGNFYTGGGGGVAVGATVTADTLLNCVSAADGLCTSTDGPVWTVDGAPYMPGWGPITLPVASEWLNETMSRGGMDGSATTPQRVMPSSGDWTLELLSTPSGHDYVFGIENASGEAAYMLYSAASNGRDNWQMYDRPNGWLSASGQALRNTGTLTNKCGMASHRLVWDDTANTLTLQTSCESGDWHDHPYVLTQATFWPASAPVDVHVSTTAFIWHAVES